MSQQFVKNTNVPSEDSVLWQLGDGWKISQQTGIAYTALKNIDHDDLATQLREQKKKKELVQVGDYYFICKPFQDGTRAAYAYPLTEKAKADKDLGYAVKALLALDATNVNTTTAPKQQELSTVPEKPGAVMHTMPTPTQIAQSIPQSSNKLSQVIEVPYDIQPIEWDDAMAIDSAVRDGLFLLPVKYTGVENWGFKGDNGKRTFYYGRIKLVRIQEE